MPQSAFPFFPEGVTHITALLAFRKQDGQITDFNGAMPVFIHDAEDMDSFRMITAQFCVNGNAKQADIVRAIGVTKISLKRAVKRYREHGPRGFYLPRKRRGTRGARKRLSIHCGRHSPATKGPRACERRGLWAPSSGLRWWPPCRQRARPL